MDDYIIKPAPKDPRLTKSVVAVDHEQAQQKLTVPMERALGLYLNGQEIVTMMTVGDYPEYLSVGFLLNQNMLSRDDEVTGIDVDEEIDVVVVRTKRKTDYESKLKKKTMTSGCAQGTAFGDIMEKFDDIELAGNAVIKTSWLYALSRKINTTDSLYLEAGAIHGCVLCHRDRPLIYMEDIGRHNAVDKIAGYLFINEMLRDDKILYTTGRLTSEMVIKCVQMSIPILISRSGFTASGVDLAKRANLTLIGRAKGKRFVCVSGEHRLVFDADPSRIPVESRKVQRKAGLID